MSNLKGRNGISYAADWVLADASWSMNELVAGSNKTRLDALNAALSGFPPNVQLLAFHDSCYHVRNRQRLTYGGGEDTNICPPLSFVLDYRPALVSIISDGEFADPPERAFALASQIARYAVIDTLYIGSDSEPAAIRFMQRLADIGHGTYRRHDSTKPQQQQLEHVIRALLPSPSQIIKL